MKKSSQRRICVVILICLFILSTSLSLYSQDVNPKYEKLKTLLSLKGKAASSSESNNMISGSGEDTQKYVEGEILVKFKEGSDPYSVLQYLDLASAETRRIHSIKPASDKFKKDYKLEKDSNGWYWFLGKQYQEQEEIPDIELFKEAYNNMPTSEKKLYDIYKIALPEGTNVEEAAALLNASGEVEFAEPNYIVKAMMVP
ncbi:MAG: hypothetical protein ABH843_05640, partial [Candidatus Omnitrophota bacterium]